MLAPNRPIKQGPNCGPCGPRQILESPRKLSKMHCCALLQYDMSNKKFDNSACNPQEWTRPVVPHIIFMRSNHRDLK